MADPPASDDRWTLGAIRARNMRLEAACAAPDCGWFASFDLDKLIEGLCPDYPPPDQGPGIACEKCGSDTVRFQLAMVPPGSP